jgi:molecular chaperone GrpE
MTDDTTTPDDLKAETAADAPELAEHDRVTALEAEIADLKS